MTLIKHTAAHGFFKGEKTISQIYIKQTLQAALFILQREALTSPPLPLLGDILNKHLLLLQQGPSLQQGVLTSPPLPLLGDILNYHLLLLQQGHSSPGHLADAVS